MDNITASQIFSVARRRRGARSVCPDEDLSRLGATFADLDVAVLSGDMSPQLQDQWWRVVHRALSIRATAARGRRIKATMLLAVIRQTHADGPACDMARSVALDLTGRQDKKRRPPLPAEVRTQYFVEKGLSRRAARVLTALGCQTADDVLSLKQRDLGSRRNCGRVTVAELSAFAQERRRLQGMQ